LTSTLAFWTAHFCVHTCINKNISNENIYTWYTFATEIFKEVELNKNNFEDFNKSFLLVKDTFKNMFKKNIKEKYLKNINLR
jgi:dTDP-4-dehydrorhamnose reductase